MKANTYSATLNMRLKLLVAALALERNDCVFHTNSFAVVYASISQLVKRTLRNAAQQGGRSSVFHLW